MSVDATLAVCEDHDAGDGICGACGYHFLGIITYVCNACKFAFRAPSWAPVHRHPALVSFYFEHGIDHVLRSWAAISRSLEWREELLSAEPPELRITVPHGGDVLDVVLDERGTVVDVERRLSK